MVEINTDTLFDAAALLRLASAGAEGATWPVIAPDLSSMGPQVSILEVTDARVAAVTWAQNVASRTHHQGDLDSFAAQKYKDVGK